MGEEEATMRERLVEGMARAICESTEADVFDELPEQSIYRATYVQQARDALDAALDLLVAETMAQFDEQIAVYETKKDQAWNADMQERFDRFENYRDAADHMRGRIEDMLATLRSPKI